MQTPRLTKWPDSAAILHSVLLDSAKNEPFSPPRPKLKPFLKTGKHQSKSLGFTGVFRFFSPTALAFLPFLLSLLLTSSPIFGHQLSAQSLSRHTFTHFQMGTQFRVILYTDTEERAQGLSSQAFTILDQLNASLSDYLPESELNSFCAKAGERRKSRLSQDFWQVLKLSKVISRKSKGAFDVTIGPLSKLWRKAFKKGSFPEASAIAKARQRVNHRWIKLATKTPRAALVKPNMQLDLGGIAKGYAADKMAEVFSQAGYHHYLIDAGGDLLLGAAPPDRQGWKISIAHKTGQAPLQLSNCAVATSGDTYQYLEWEGKKYSHIIDPRTGYGLVNQQQVTVIAPTASLADALASAASVLGEEAGLRLVQKFDQCSASFQAPTAKH